MPGDAVFAGAAEGGKAGNDGVARLDVIDERTDFLHHTGCLVPQHDRHLCRVETFNEMQVRVADTAGRRFHQNHARAWIVDVNVFDHQWRMRLPHNRCFHRYCPLVVTKLIDQALLYYITLSNQA